LDGELYADKFANNFNTIVSLVKKTKPTSDDLKQSANNIEYHVYDIPSVTSIFKERCIELDELSLDFPKCIKQVETHIANNESEVIEWYENYVERGYEGQILRLNGPYENKRSKFLLKHKSFQDSEFPILDICEGEGNKTGQVGYMVFEIEGKRFKSNVKCSWEEGAEILKNKNKLIGKSATIQYFNLTPDGIPRFPYVININREEYE
jgi:DNA ligase-1